MKRMRAIITLGLSVVLLVAFHFICGLSSAPASSKVWDYAILTLGYATVIYTSARYFKRAKSC